MHPSSVSRLFVRFVFTWLLALGGFTPSISQAANTFEDTGALIVGRRLHTATLLPNGKVLVAGGYNGSYLASAELYDPATGTWTATGSLNTARSHHTATLLPNGKVLIAGGNNGSTTFATAELYDPAGNGGEGSWTATGSLGSARSSHTATLLSNGKVLVAGGRYIGSTLISAELYDPATGIWAATGSLATARSAHTATLLPNGTMLVVGGVVGSTSFATAELYDPATGIWAATGSLGSARSSHTATLLPNGKVLVAGGDSYLINGNIVRLTSAELYNPATGIWTATGSLDFARHYHTATLLPNGKVLVAGGVNGSSGSLAGVELYDPAGNGGVGSWTATGSLATGRDFHSATLLPDGKVLVAGGDSNGSLSTAQLYDSAVGTWATTNPLAIAREQHTATLLPNGKVLVAGRESNVSFASAELYDPGTGTWTATNPLATARYNYTATLLPNGKVLVAGGFGGVSLASAELYDPNTGTWTATNPLATARYLHTATLLPNGKVLVAGGYGDSGILASAELYDPATGTWTSIINPLAAARYLHTATLLPNGKVLVAGGYGNSGYLASAELYDPATGTWTATANPLARAYHTATLLPNGKVLVAGGHNNSNGTLASAELYDPATDTWTATTTPLATARENYTATLLPNGKVLVAGGYNNSNGSLASAELYDPATSTWTAAANPLATARYYHTATLLPNGKVLVAGGRNNSYLASAELYDVGLGFSGALQPVISSATFNASNQLVLTGTGLRGISGASGGNGSQDSPTNYPVVQLRRLDSEQSTFLLSDPAASTSDTAFTSAVVPGSSGYALATVFTNGIPSEGFMIALPSAQADLSITKTDGVTTATPGGSVTYTITASNAGPNDITGATVADIFPASLTATWTSAVAGGATATAAGSGNINDMVDLPAGGSVTYTVIAQISPSATGSLTNTATISSAVTDPNLANNSATDTDTLTPHANLTITKTDGVTTVTPGGSVTYTITASNAGPSDVTGATVADIFPASLTATWSTAVAGGATATVAGSGNIDDTVNLPAGGSVTYTVIAQISPSATGSLTNTVTISSAVTDPNLANNSATDTDTLTPQADLTIIKTDGVTTVTPGGSVTYTITASNAGPSDVTGATVADTFPASLTATWSTAVAGGATATVAGSGNIDDTVNLPAGGSVTYTVTAQISPSATGSLSSTATISSAVIDPNPANNSATDTDTLTPQADLTIIKTDGVTTATPGGSVTYTITASNPGPSDVTAATVADIFPASLTATWTSAVVGGATATAAGSGNINDMVNLPANGSVTYTVTAQISASATGSLSNTATISSAVTDPNPANNSATDTDTLTPQSDLAINFASKPAIAVKGTNVTYNIILTNNGPSDASATAVSFPLPSQVTFVSATTPGGWSATKPAVGSGGAMTYSIASLAKGATVNFTVVGKVKSTAVNGTVLTAIAAVSSTSVDSVQANNHAAAVAAVGTAKPTALQIGTTGKLNPQNGLFELTIKVTNTTAGPINGFRLQVDYSDYKIAYPGLKLYNAKGSKKKFKTHIDYPFPVASNGVVSMKLRFYSRNRNLPATFSPKLKVKELLAGQVTWPKGKAVAVRSVRLSNKYIQIEFPSVIGKWYRVRYSEDKIHWQDCLVPIKASTTRTQWIDSGPPFTEVPPSQVANRYYRVNEISAH